MPDQPLIDGLMDSAVNAATSDSRFPSVGEGELKNISIEVSVLTVPDRVEVDDIHHLLLTGSVEGKEEEVRVVLEGALDDLREVLEG
ncbi:hypothetical protein AKJ41_03375 [candidate division MSBL1 archaeon SCGC-AAA259O05]|uniref:AMMECR1 domain-containing protein n=1 Tax=candidate division MSBL1 archaeon SCGC-AAA259O05 TaxID=1698271 RepID=A0A133V3D1_9EURY|nr:hypothetical protein AKJ41_03375 [candidate division MSBL1 archaeon SCGC-AAA259O05]